MLHSYPPFPIASGVQPTPMADLPQKWQPTFSECAGNRAGVSDHGYRLLTVGQQPAEGTPCKPTRACGRSPDGWATQVMMSCENVHKTYLLGIEGIPALRGVRLRSRVIQNGALNVEAWTFRDTGVHCQGSRKEGCPSLGGGALSPSLECTPLLSVRTYPPPWGGDWLVFE